MRFGGNPYSWLGLGLSLSGALLTPVSYLILRSIPLTALGLSVIILGVVCLVLGTTRPIISPEVALILLETGLENISALVEELGLRSKAIYLPSSLTGGQPQALIPLKSNPSLPRLKGPLPKRLIVKFGPNAEDIGLLITTPGSATVNMLESKPGATSGELEAALTSVLTGSIDLADSVKVSIADGRITIEVSHPRIERKDVGFYRYLGSPLASIAASIAGEAWDRPLVIEGERDEGGKKVIELGVLGEDLQ